MSLPELKTLRVLDTSWTSNFTTSSLARAKTCQVEKLEIGSLDTEDLQKLLRLMPELRHLKCDTPGFRGQQFNSNTEIWDITTPLSPVAVAQSLESVMTQLESLHLYNDQKCWIEHDGSKLDLGGYTKLRTLTIKSSFLFEWHNDCETRGNIHKLLPPSIEVLKVSGKAHGHLFRNTDCGIQINFIMSYNASHFIVTITHLARQKGVILQDEKPHVVR